MGVEKNHESNTIHRTTIEKYCPPPLRKCQESNELQNKQVNKTKATTINPVIENKSECTQQSQILSESSSTTSNNSNSINIVRPARRERRPDREVYVPRARRSQTSIPNQTNTNISPLPSSYNNRSILEEKLLSTTNNNKKIKDLNHQCPQDQYQQNYHQHQQQNKSLKNPIADDKRHLSSTTSTTNVTKSSCEIVSNKPVIITKSSKINNYCDNKSTDKVTNSNNFTENLLQNQKQIITKKNKTVNSELVNNCDSLDVIQNSINSTNTVTRTHQQNRHQLITDMNKTNKMSNLNVQNHQRENSSTLRIEDANKFNNKIDHDALELERASKEINRSNRRIIKQTFKSDVLEIPETNFKNTNAVDYIANANQDDKPAKFKTVDPETDDWDSIFDDNGECLDPKLIEELTATVGKVQIDTPKSDYSAYLMKQDILSEEEFPHVLEISNFPVEFKTQDLMMIFSGYKESGFDIKWVDDTHALAVFSSSKIAAEVLAKHHPLVVLKPLAEATFESRTKAKKCSSSLQPYRPRPETCAALARRLVTGALGVRLKTAAQERENEKRVLKEAKERKLLAAKQRDEIWES